MKVFLYVSFLFLTLCASSQNKKLIISADGIDSIKIGMSKIEVEKSINSKLQPYINHDSGFKKQDTAKINVTCEDCMGIFTCNYNGAELSLIFFHAELVSISSLLTSSFIETKTGIKVGITEEALIANCKKNYKYKLIDIDENSKGCYFSENLNSESAKAMFVRIDKGIVTSLSVAKLK